MFELYHKYGLLVLFIAAIIVIAAVVIYNWMSGKNGTFFNHSALIWKLFNVTPSQSASAGKRTSFGEAECRRVAEAYFKRPFPNCRPSFLKNQITNCNMELDCYCQELQLAIEYNGRQHYEYIPHFHSSKDAFYTTRYRDELKQQLCRDNGVTLIVVPYTVKNIEEYLTNEFNNIDRPRV